MNGKLFILTGPSGVGKTTVYKELRKGIPNLKKVITCTTREIRNDEKDGIDYRFYSKDEFLGMIDRGEMFEWAKVYDHYYGSRKVDVKNALKEGKTVLMVIDVQGARTIKNEHPDVKVIFLNAESADILEKRIKSREKVDPEDLARRREELPEELLFAEKSDFVIENKEGELESTVKTIKDIVEKEIRV